MTGLINDHATLYASVTMLAAGTEKAVGTPLMLVTCR